MNAALFDIQPRVVAGFHTGDRLRRAQGVGVETDAHLSRGFPPC
jgi:hypothetical protein